MALTTRAQVQQTLGLTDDATASAAITVAVDPASTLTSCTVTVNSSSTSISIVTAPGTTTTFSLTAAAYDTLGELATAINAITGITAAIATGLSTSTASTLLTASQSFVLLDSPPSIGQLTYSNAGNGTSAALIDQLILDATAMIQRHCGRTFATATFTESYDGTNTPYLLLKQSPVTSITSVSILSSDGTSTTVDSTTYRCNLATGQLDRIGGVAGYFGNGFGATNPIWNIGYSGYQGPAYNRDFSVAWPAGFQNIVVVYVAGYATIPDDLQRAATTFVCDLYFNRRSNRALSLDRANGRQTQQATPSEQWERMSQLLSPWKRLDAGA